MYGMTKKKKEKKMYGGGGYNRMMGGGMMQYNKGGYASIQDMEKHCGTKAPQNTMK
jgi:hypothetical protein